MRFKTLIDAAPRDLAFIVGNGINRYPNNPKALSWEDLLIQLWTRFTTHAVTEIPKGISITEFYDLLDIESTNFTTTNPNIQKEASILLENWSEQPHHKRFLEKAKQMNAPVLTTNFDLILPNALGLKLLYTDTKGFSDFYLWTAYYGDQQLSSPTDGFGVWYINGVMKYHRSIRLGLSHYMGSVEKARTLIHKGAGEKLYSTDDDYLQWGGNKTWLHLVFNRSLCIFGLALEENEVFLRWLLIERAKYYRKFPERRKQGWYVMRRPAEPDTRYFGKKYFFEKIGFQVIEVEKHEEVYEVW